MKNIFACIFLFMLTVSMGDRIRTVENASSFPKMSYTEYDASQVQKNSGRLFLRGEIIRESDSNL